MGKVLMTILTERLRNLLEEHLSDELAGFRKDRSTTDSHVETNSEEGKAQGQTDIQLLCRLQKGVRLRGPGNYLGRSKSYGVDHKLINLLKDINETSQVVVRVDGERYPWFNTNRGTRQGDPISPTVFIADLKGAKDRNKERQSGITVHSI